MNAFRPTLALALAGAASIAMGEPVLAQAPAAPAAAPVLDGANTAWLLTATGLVLFMTLPGLALFYGGLVTGTIAGLATITPASGSVGPLGGLVIGFAAGLVCYWAVGLIKRTFGTDDSLDVFGVHGIGGMLGVILAAVFAAPSLQGLGYAEGMTMGSQLWVQVVGVVATLVWATVVTYIILKIVDVIAGLRARDDEETEGLDITEHGERGYNL